MKQRVSDHPSPICPLNGGFTLLEVLVALSILGIAITVVMQLFSANLQAIAASESYSTAVTRAETKMREVLDDENLSENSWSERSDDGSVISVSVAESLKERTETLPVRLLEVTVTVRWIKGKKERSVTLRTMKTVIRQV